MKRSTIGVPTAIGAGILLAVAAPLSASAHVTIDPGQATAGSYAVVTVRVPNESETASTNRVELTLPTDTPFSSVRYVPVAGWSAELVRETLPEPVTVGDTTLTEAVTSVVWTADAGSEIGRDELQLFPLSLGPVPDTGSVVLATAQGYTDGSVVDWDETDDAAEHPAPVLYIDDAPPANHHGAAAVTLEAQPAQATPATAADDVLARVLGIGGLVVGAVGVVLAIASRRKAVR
ncbi:MAG: hypothetical protein JWM50_2544 [Microbacteriaceae bacterium]|jgi:uncharacterized protein YcnI|nr:hypothetical protein [Microbacteriaceae bacterium]